MRKVVGIGETILDMVFKSDEPKAAVAGGSVLNTIVSLSRCGVKTAFVSEVGNDVVGAKILRFLCENGVSIENIAQHDGMKTPVSIAFLNERNEAEYAFYRAPMSGWHEEKYPEVCRDDVLVIGSYYSVNPEVRPKVVDLLRRARAKGAIVFYDLNFRAAHKDDLPRVKENIVENMRYADIVRGSRDDFMVVFGTDDVGRVCSSEVGRHCKRLVCTDGADEVALRCGNGFVRTYKVLSAETVSTIGAGDNFNAGLVYGLMKHGVTRERLLRGLSVGEWDRLVGCAMEFAAACCKEIFNYVPNDFGNTKRHELTAAIG